MGYEKEELESTALEAIEKHTLIFIDEVVSYLPCNRATFYNHKLDKLDTIVNALSENKVTEKVKLRKKWRDSDNAALQTNLYKLCSSDEEQAILNPSKAETTVHIHSEKQEDLTKLSTDELKQRYEAAKDAAAARERDTEKGD